jgi:microsomal dipeptidase-like Zn-dependent dipeptidase
MAKPCSRRSLLKQGGATEDGESGLQVELRVSRQIDTDGCDDPPRFYDLAGALARFNYSDANIEAVLGGNCRRLPGQV